jgi:hypothetical protein
MCPKKGLNGDGAVMSIVATIDVFSRAFFKIED